MARLAVMKTAVMKTINTKYKRNRQLCNTVSRFPLLYFVVETLFEQFVKTIVKVF